MSWLPLGVLVLAQIGYPLTDGAARARLVVVIVLLGCAASVTHAVVTRGRRAGLALVTITAGGGLAIEILGVHTGFPFGEYAYSGALGPRLAGVPLVVPLAWTWMAWPAWLASLRLTPLLAPVALAAWDLFLDPQMVAEGYWRWADPAPALPGVPDVPVSNYLGWLAVAALMMLGLAATTGRAVRQDAPMYAMYLWTCASGVLAHAVFLGLPWSALWGGLAMGGVAIPLVLCGR